MEKAVARGTFHPVLPAVPTSVLGVAELLELICRAFPSPEEHQVDAFTPAGARLPAAGPDGTLIAEIVKTTTDPYVGRISLVRIYRGTLEPDAPVHVSGHFAQFSGHPVDENRHPAHDVDERVGTVSRTVGATLTGIPRAGAGRYRRGGSAGARRDRRHALRSSRTRRAGPVEHARTSAADRRFGEIEHR